MNDIPAACVRPRTANLDVGLSRNNANTCSHDVIHVSELLSFHIAIIKGNLVCLPPNMPLIMVVTFESACGGEKVMKSLHR
jgi:hypothetical protein